MTLSKIQWTKYTWNPWHGCIKVSPGCKNCYMYRDKEIRYNQNPKDVKKSLPKTFNAPLSWAGSNGFVFTCSWSDFFIEHADSWRPEAWKIIKETPNLVYQILTKRPERILECLPSDWGDGYQNVWLGISAENQKTFIDRGKILSEIPAVKKFISAEPLLSEIDLLMPSINAKENVFNIAFVPLILQFDWVIVGGESGATDEDVVKYRARKCKLEWIEKIVFDCKAVSIPVFVKQTGSVIAKKDKMKHYAGGNPDEWVKTIQVREIPDVSIVTEKGLQTFKADRFL